MTEVTPNTDNTATIDEFHKSANTYVAHHSFAEHVEHLAEQYRKLSASQNSNRVLRTELQQTIDTVTAFIKDHMELGADTGDLKKLAADLDIELMKDIKVTFTVTYEAELTVPHDFDLDGIDESDFTVNVEFSSPDDDVQFDNDSTEIDDFEVQEA